MVFSPFAKERPVRHKFRAISRPVFYQLTTTSIIPTP
jgi:hypothetical protein